MTGLVLHLLSVLTLRLTGGKATDLLDKAKISAYQIVNRKYR